MLRVPNRRFWMNPALISQNTSRMAYFSPFGKAHDTVIPSLPRVRGSLLQLHSWTKELRYHGLFRWVKNMPYETYFGKLTLGSSKIFY